MNSTAVPQPLPSSENTPRCGYQALRDKATQRCLNDYAVAIVGYFLVQSRGCLSHTGGPSAQLEELTLKLAQRGSAHFAVTPLYPLDLVQV